MQRLRAGFGFYCLLAAACVSDNSRYRDTSALEKPPTLAVEKPAASETPESDEAGKPAGESEESAADSETDQQEATTEAKRGLGDSVVSISETPPLVLTIRQSFDVAWNSLKKALVQSGIEVTDLMHDKGKFFVTYDADSFVSQHGTLLEKSFGLFSNDYTKQGYQLMLAAEEGVTKVSSAPVKDAEFQKRTDRDDEQKEAESEDDSEHSKPTDGADKLLRSIYLTLRDDLREN